MLYVQGSLDTFHNSFNTLAAYIGIIRLTLRLLKHTSEAFIYSLVLNPNSRTFPILRLVVDSHPPISCYSPNHNYETQHLCFLYILLSSFFLNKPFRLLLSVFLSLHVSLTLLRNHALLILSCSFLNFKNDLHEDAQKQKYIQNFT